MISLRYLYWLRQGVACALVMGACGCSPELDAASSAIGKTNLIPALRINLGPIDSISATAIDVGQPEFLFFFNAHCAHC